MDYDRRDNVPGVNRNGDFNTLYSGSFAISSLHTYVKQLLHIRNNRNDYMKIVGPSLNETEAEDSWYNMCMQSLFQPSDYLKHYLNPYLEVFSRTPCWAFTSAAEAPRTGVIPISTLRRRLSRWSSTASTRY